MALGFKHIQTPSGLMPCGMYSEQYSAAPSGRGPKQRGRKSMIVSLGEMETQAGSLATRDGINLTRTVAKTCHVLYSFVPNDTRDQIGVASLSLIS